MFTTAVILACLIEIVHIPPAEPLPIGLVHDDVIHDYGFIGHETGETHRLGGNKDYERPNWIRIILMLFTSLCYIASVKARNLRDKMMFIIIASVLSCGVLLF
jgi:hypothetical protein